MLEWLHFSPTFVYGVVVGELLCIISFCLLLKIIFPRKKLFTSYYFNTPFEHVELPKKDMDPFGCMSEYFLKIYKPSTNSSSSTEASTYQQHIHRHQSSNNNKKGIIYSRSGFDDNSSIWLNEIIQTALFYYKTSNTMHSTIKSMINKILSESLSPFFTSPEFDFLLGLGHETINISHPTITDIYQERCSNDLSDISIRFHLHWDNVGTFVFGANATILFQSKVLGYLPLGVGLHVDKISGYVFLRLYRKSSSPSDAILAISLHPNFVFRLRVISNIGDTTQSHQPIRNNGKVAQIVEWAIRQSFENALVYPNVQVINLSTV